ncbi:MAG: transporter substrate-binding protein, partial [Geminicoccaceae bacterium]|nr:transporter substrate-binding protein [Geminicoccaceae bacterium]
PTAELLVNREAFEALPADLQAIVEAAASASAMEYHADYAFHNVVSLQPLVAEHGLELRLFPNDVVAALGRTSQEVLAELGERTPLTRRIHASYMAFRAQANLYSQWFDLPMLRMRAAALGRVWPAPACAGR